MILTFAKLQRLSGLQKPTAVKAWLIGIEPKRLLGRMIRNKLGDPIGGQTPEGIKVYAWSLPTPDDSAEGRP